MAPKNSFIKHTETAKRKLKILTYEMLKRIKQELQKNKSNNGSKKPAMEIAGFFILL